MSPIFRYYIGIITYALIFFQLSHMACMVPRLESKPRALPVEIQSPKCWIPGNSPDDYYNKYCYLCIHV